jgi:hypothetical protein
MVSQDEAFSSITVAMPTRKASTMIHMTTTRFPGKSYTNAAKIKESTFDLLPRVAISK